MTQRSRLLTASEVEDIKAAYLDPDFLARLREDAKTANTVEVDNPFRIERRPRRGTQ